MSEVTARSGRSRPVERFKPTSGHILGYAGIGMAMFAAGYVVWTEHSMTGLRIGLGAVFFATLVWVTQVRPRAAVYADHVLLKNALRDAHVPLAAVDEVGIGQTLSLWVGERRFTCIGIGNSIRSDVKARHRAALEEADIGTSRFSELRRKADMANLDERAMTYQTFVVTRLEELIEVAKREHARAEREPGQPRWQTAWPEVALLAISGAAFVVTLFL